jgi:ammonia channel protein AmtB
VTVAFFHVRVQYIYSSYDVGHRKESYVPSSVSLTGTFLLAFSSLIINSLGTSSSAAAELAVLNTGLVQATAITTAAGLLILLSSLRRAPLDFQLLQGSLLAGGVAAGPVAALQLQPWGALLLGLLTGLAVVLSGVFLEPLLARGLGLPTSYYIVSIHGLPALIGGAAGVFMAAIAEEKSGGKSKFFQKKLDL